MENDHRDEAIDSLEATVSREASTTPVAPEGFKHLEHKERAQKISLRQLFAEQEHGLRQKYADWIIWLLGAQFVVADTVFIVFAWAGRSWDLSPGVIEVWLAATVVQVVGVVALVTRHLFPGREGPEASA